MGRRDTRFQNGGRGQGNLNPDFIFSFDKIGTLIVFLEKHSFWGISSRKRKGIFFFKFNIDTSIVWEKEKDFLD